MQDLVVQLFSEDFVTHIALPLTFLRCNELYCGGNRLLHQGAEQWYLKESQFEECKAGFNLSEWMLARAPPSLCN